MIQKDSLEFINPEIYKNHPILHKIAVDRFFFLSWRAAAERIRQTVCDFTIKMDG